jgi:predicted RNase H-like HicB family nuclease
MRADYLKFVQWSDEDGVYVGYCPDLFIGGVCHGKDERKVYAELCRLVAEEIADLQRRKHPIPQRKALVAMAVSV